MAAAKLPTPEVLRDTEQWYRHIYNMDGLTHVQFPDSYPTSALLGCVDVVGVDAQETFQARDSLPASVRLAAAAGCVRAGGW